MFLVSSQTGLIRPTVSDHITGYHADIGRSALKLVLAQTQENENPKIGVESWKSDLLRWELGVADPRRSSSTSVTTSSLVVLRQKVCVRINRREPPRLGSAGTPPTGWGVTDRLKQSTLPKLCCHVKFGSSASKGMHK